MAEKKGSLAKRLLLSAVLVPFGFYTVLWAPGWFYLLVLEIFLLMGLWEYFNIAEKKGFVINRFLGMMFAVLLPLSYEVPAESVILMTAVLCIFLFNFNRRYKDQALISTALTLFGLIYVGWFMSYLAKLKYLPNGSIWVCYVILIVKMGDAGAYFIGRKYGAHKYALHISPNKSIEGAVGGFLATLFWSLVYKVFMPEVPLIHFFWLGIVVGVLSQLGDLAESLIKREVGMKDSGSWPGLGGVLDVFDSLLLTVPCVYYYVLMFQSGILS